MEPILTPAEMAEADRRTIAAGTPVEVLMDRAGHAVAWEVRQRLGRTYGARVVVVCGKGNNGGDGLVAARVLRGWGVRVDVLELADGIPADVLDRVIARADVLVDGMFGTGFRGGSGRMGRAARGAREPSHPDGRDRHPLWGRRAHRFGCWGQGTAEGRGRRRGASGLDHHVRGA